MIVMDGQEFMTAQEACTTLGIKPATLYAYVSRGFLASYRQGIKRMRLYRREDVERLLRLRGPEESELDGEDDDAGGDEDTREWIPYV